MNRKLRLAGIIMAALAAGATQSAYAAGFDSGEEYENCITRAIRAQANCMGKENPICG